jgi:AraC-like DNA-binding protein
MTSNAIRERQGDYLLDLLTIVAGDPSSVPYAVKNDVALSRAKRYIAQHLHNVDLDAAHIATSLGLTRSRLYRSFKETGTSLMRYVWSCRLDRAAELLTRQGGTTVTIREIAYRCGFENAAHFSRAFKGRFGVTPKDAVVRGIGAKSGQAYDENNDI